jgi:hypothetical protein
VALGAIKPAFTARGANGNLPHDKPVRRDKKKGAKNVFAFLSSARASRAIFPYNPDVVIWLTIRSNIIFSRQKKSKKQQHAHQGKEKIWCFLRCRIHLHRAL